VLLGVLPLAALVVVRVFQGRTRGSQTGSQRTWLRTGGASSVWNEKESVVADLRADGGTHLHSSSLGRSSPPGGQARVLVSYVYYEAALQSECERNNKRTNLVMFLLFAVANTDPSAVHFTFTFPGQGTLYQR
jgi:hypothetical protein